MAIKKFRPYFTEAEMLEIISALKTSPTPTRLGIIKYLQTFLRKIEDGNISPSHTLLPGISEKLGLEPTASPNPQIIGEAAYQKQLIDPKHCTPKEIEIAMAYRYENNLMSSDEEASYEKNILGL